jgi:hypothetical protein
LQKSVKKAIILSSRLLLPSGETRNGLIHINFESEGVDHPEIYRLPVRGGESILYLVEPGTYRFAPTRRLFGSVEPELSMTIEGRSYQVPFPREFLRLDPFLIKPKKILTLGVIEIRILPSLPGQTPEIRLKLDDSVTARKKIIQELIKDMTDSNRPTEARDSAIAWSRALQNSLIDILSEIDQRPLYKIEK